MAFFILKKPAFITFNMEKYSENMSLMSKHQILSNGNTSNASLVKHRNGKWYIKYGNVLLEMKDVKCKEMTISKINHDVGTFVEKVNCKWFLQNTANL
ncbi:uncharacterized protein VICG_01848 [Vittaforma corneae ATCC 50505]|uniref:Uncharacterized protein n=1 Tax=Vittaforma corneae (strain ATCC 50505) TaxID=993615 RepID=L2GKK9_VITCO|nr:uncharacterized protein VICG_01848 [Vittaforma corneae ATCC 50505]ELA41149.1 hypothetical protein VICG_01848 [Vittaforma corneae ATCC 50505]